MTTKRKALVWMLLIMAKVIGFIITIGLWSFATSWLVDNNHETIGIIVWFIPTLSIVLFIFYGIYLDKVEELDRYSP